MARPREFDEDTAVEAAMEVFWERGYVNTSLDSLEEATGLNRSSLYNAFGGKLALFQRSLGAYSAGPTSVMHHSLSEKRGATAILSYFRGIAAFFDSPIGSRGCLMVNTGLEDLAREDRQVRAKLDAHFATLRSLLAKRFSEAIAKGQVASDLKPVEAGYLLTSVARGVLASAASGEPSAHGKRAIRALIKQFAFANC